MPETLSCLIRDRATFEVCRNSVTMGINPMRTPGFANVVLILMRVFFHNMALDSNRSHSEEVQSGPPCSVLIGNNPRFHANPRNFKLCSAKPTFSLPSV